MRFVLLPGQKKTGLYCTGSGQTSGCGRVEANIDGQHINSIIQCNIYNLNNVNSHVLYNTYLLSICCVVELLCMAVIKSARPPVPLQLAMLVRQVSYRARHFGTVDRHDDHHQYAQGINTRTATARHVAATTTGTPSPVLILASSSSCPRWPPHHPPRTPPPPRRPRLAGARSTSSAAWSTTSAGARPTTGATGETPSTTASSRPPCTCILPSKSTPPPFLLAANRTTLLLTTV